MNEIEEFQEHVPLKEKVAFGLIVCFVALTSGIAFSAITFYYNVKLGLSAELLGLGWLIFAVWNTLNDPLFGFLEDRTKTRWGRRIPYVRIGGPLIGISFILCWFPLFALTQFGLFLFFLLVLFIFDTIFTIVGLITATFQAEMCITAKERANVLVLSNIFWGFGFLASFIIPILYLTSESSTYVNPFFLSAMIIVGILSGSMIFASSYFLKENLYTQADKPLGFIDSFKETFKNTPFLKYEIANFSYWIALTILTTGVFYYINYILKLSGFLALIPLLLIFLMIFVFLPVFGKLAGKYDLKFIFIAGYGLTGVSFILAFFFGWTLITAIVPLLLIGIGFSSIVLLRPAVLADLIDFDETLTGKRRETTYAGINAVIEKPAISIANWLFLIIISFYGFQSAASQQSPTAQLGIMVGLTVIPAIFLIFSTIVMKFYPLAGSEWKEKKVKLKRIHEQKEQDYIRSQKQI